MQEINVTIQITAEVKINGETVPETKLEVNKIVFEKVTVQNIDIK
jgi:hypothetical protein